MPVGKLPPHPFPTQTENSIGKAHQIRILTWLECMFCQKQDSARSSARSDQKTVLLEDKYGKLPLLNKTHLYHLACQSVDA